MAEAKVRVSHIAVPGNLSVLKLKSYLRTAFADAAKTKSEEEVLLVKVLVPRPLGLRAGEKFFDKVLQGIVDKDPRVTRVSVEFVDGEITPQAIDASMARIQKELDEFGHLLDEPSADAGRD
ncbi:hypothetical protein [Cupriavidus basilensis]|uniref:hypothetical protein n=1 Tax=Cupriavidus basilensis TaxID=68895 RepID=UPI0020A6592C|nr:hypothetical protein [Cupriavidus basilensis]MCP3019863.1 hypothetical protein [Cupriavidus basilensis]MDR3380657.1 hypothetical protein [Cupriavidus basilensis]